MKSEQLAKLFDKHEDEHLEFERIPKDERLHPSDDLCGLMKVASLLKKPKDFSMHAEHDVLYLASVDELKTLTEDDVIYLARCGIMFDESLDCLSTFT